MTRDARETKGKYVKAILKLSEEKPLKKITVTDLLKETDTARQTFYNHFRDINELIAYVYLYDFEVEYEKHFTRQGCVEVFEKMKKNKSFYCQLPFHNGQNNYRETHLRWLRHSYYEVGFEGVETGSREYFNRKALIDAFLYGVVGIQFDWFKNNMRGSPEAIANAIFEMRPDFIPKEPGPDFEIVPLD